MHEYAYKTLIAVLLLMGGFHEEKQQDDFIGFWEDEKKSLRMEIYYGNDYYQGRIIAIEGKDPDLFREGAYKIILIQMKRNNNVLYGGTYRDYMTIDENEARVRLVNDSLLRMKVYRGFSGYTVRWHRIK